jgi:hypothetical protein
MSVRHAAQGAARASVAVEEDSRMRDEMVLAVLAAALVGFIVMVVWLVYELRKGNVEGAPALFGTWIALSALTVGFVLVAAFVIDNALFFFFGNVAAGIGLILTVVAVFLTPVVWAVIIRHRAHRKSAEAH